MDNQLRKAIADGLQRLIVLRLPGSPASDTFLQLIAVWIDAIESRPVTWQVERDLPRIKTAFKTLIGTSPKWPSPALFMQALPQVAEPLKLTPPRNYVVPKEFRDLVAKMKMQNATGHD